MSDDAGPDHLKMDIGEPNRVGWSAARTGRVVFPFVALALILLFLMSFSLQEEVVDATVAPPIHYAALDSRVDPLPGHTRVLTVQPGDTLETVLMAGGLTHSEAIGLVNDYAGTLDPRKLMPGEIFRFDFDQYNEIVGVRLKIKGWGSLEAQREAGGFRVEAIPGEEFNDEVRFSARIETSLYDAIRDAGESPLLVQPLVDVFQWDIDFFRLQKGDWLSVAVDKRFVGEDLIGYGPVYAARFHHSGRTYEAFFHQPPDQPAAYYTSEGKPVQKQFLKAPLRFSRITSGFTQRRYHPVLKTYRPHLAIDYGAPTGTPVMTTAGGVVSFAGKGHGEGNYIRIRHTGNMETYYLHLSKFAKGIRKGASVQQGQIIGYVGSTGLATAPHLDYRVKKGGKYINPLTLKSVAPDPLTGPALARFREDLGLHLSRLEEADQMLAQAASDAAPSNS